MSCSSQPRFHDGKEPVFSSVLCYQCCLDIVFLHSVMFTICPSVAPASGEKKRKEIGILLKDTQLVKRQSQDLNPSLLTAAPVLLPLHRSCLSQDPRRY